MVDTALAESDSILKNLHDKSQLKPHEVIDAKGKLKKLAPQVDLSKNKVLDSMFLGQETIKDEVRLPLPLGLCRR